MTSDKMHNNVRQVTNSIWTFSRPFLRVNLFKIGGRATAVRLSNGDVFLVSPTQPDDTTKATLDKIGKVKYLVAPDYEHHMFLKAYKDMYPEAKLVGVEGLPERKKDEGLTFDYLFDNEHRQMSFGPGGEIDSCYFPGTPNKDVAFLHKPTKTLIEADLLFNLPAFEQYENSGTSPTSGLATKFFTFLMQPGGRVGRRLTWYAFAKNRQFALPVAWLILRFNKRDARIVSGWDFDRLIPCHGEVVETGAKKMWNDHYAWYLEEGKQS